MKGSFFLSCPVHFVVFLTLGRGLKPLGRVVRMWPTALFLTSQAASLTASVQLEWRILCRPLGGRRHSPHWLEFLARDGCDGVQGSLLQRHGPPVS